ncbi:hypothetical protein LLEC1_01495 [Akanthomyces lecanii]|uniref:DUF7707 domain-containing protein n=1 Tax=Cordyceps confragosa TaxID=2714763 RepID=A0A179I7A8_CORDF|nr:hypothetical protein LLEC1_01495 [Akanthomyces lecanii]
MLPDRWCRDEKLTCPLICQQTEPRTTLVNDCDPVCQDPRSCTPRLWKSVADLNQDTLQYGCLCGNNMQPNISEYSLSIPYYVCTEWGRQCVNKCNNDNTCASNCLQKNPCGATNPQRHNASATSSQGATASQTGSNGIYTGPPGSAGADSTTGKKTGAGSALEAGRSYGFVAVFVGMFAGFAML